jgi:hypothetical protein
MTLTRWWSPTRPTVRGALGGSLSLLRAAHPAPVLDSRAAGDLLSSLLSDVHAQSLAASDRLLVLECLMAAAEVHPAAVQALERRALDGCIAAVDGEKDPRCLGLAFRLWPRLACLFPPDGAAMRACAEEMHDVMACYFPLVFNPPPGAPADRKHRLTRDALAADLAAALTCTPAFAPFAMPLVIGKLAVPADHDALAIEDSLRALQTAALSFPPSAAATHVHSIWRGLRAVLLPGGDGQDDAGESTGTRRRLAGDTLSTVLRVLAAAPGNHAAQCVDEILADAAVQQLCSLMLAAPMAARASQDISVRGRAAEALSAVSTLLAATARSSVSAACRVHTTIMPTMIAAIPQHKAGLPHREALVLAAHVTVAASEAACSAASAAGGGGKRLGAPFGALSGATLQVFLSAAVTADAHMADADDDAEEIAGDALGALSTGALGVAGLKAMLLVPPPFDALDEADRARAADALTSVALSGGDSAVNGDAAAALAAVAEASDAGFALVSSTCLPKTLHAISSCNTADSCSAAMACARTLASARANALAPHLAGALAQRLQAQLPGAAHDTVQQVLLLQLRALEALCSTCRFPSCDMLAAFAAWALHSAEQVPELARPSVASAAGAAAAACGVDAQTTLAAPSAEAVLTEPACGSCNLVAAHLLCALHPGQPAQPLQPAVLAARLVQLAAMAAGPGLEAVLLQSVASLVNKSADDVVAAHLMTSQLSPAALTVGASSQASLVARIKVAGYVASGLAWRGARGGMSDIPALLLPLLRAQPLEHAPVLAAAAAALALPLESCKDVKNALIRTMTAQRYFTAVIQMLLAQLCESTGDARSGSILGAHRCTGSWRALPCADPPRPRSSGAGHTQRAPGPADEHVPLAGAPPARVSGGGGIGHIQGRGAAVLGAGLHV